MTAEIGALIDRTDAAIEQTQEAIRRVREASKADATLARAMDAANKDADDGSARA
ncbi:MAG TPA: hypothetical protein VHL98_13005 [Microvirga sp.]|nr:hypothetical protein [Microvirga sp.]